MKSYSIALELFRQTMAGSSSRSPALFVTQTDTSVSHDEAESKLQIKK